MGSDRRIIEISDHGCLCRTDYTGLLGFHGGGAVFGATVGFRALQAASAALCRERLWDRRDIRVVSGHAGPGVRDAFEYVTRCVSRGRYELGDDAQPEGCHSANRFTWWIRARDNAVAVTLADGFVPAEFLSLADRVREGTASRRERQDLEVLKGSLSVGLWRRALEELYSVSEARWMPAAGAGPRAAPAGSTA